MSKVETFESLSEDDTLEKRSKFYPLKKAFTVAKYQYKFIFTYRMHVFLMFFSIAFDLGIYFFLGMIVDTGKIAGLGYGTSYLLFVLLGVSLGRYLWSSMARISHQTHHAYLDGYFEYTTGTRAGVHSWMLGLAVYGFSWGSLWLFATLFIGSFAGLPLHLTPLTVLGTLLALLLGVIVHTGIGLVLAGVSIVYKRLDPVVFILNSLFSLFGGVMYPYSVLQQFWLLHYISLIIPFTHTLAIVRLALGGGQLLTATVLYHFLFLLPFLIFVPLGIKSVDYYYDKARLEGGVQSY